MSNWKEVKLGSLCNLRRGASPRPISDSKYFGNGAGWVRISDVTSSKKYLKQTSQRLSSLGESKSVRVVPGDVIMSICATIGKPVIVDMDACIHDGFVVFKDLNPAVDNEFLIYWLNMKEGYFNSLGQQGTQKNLNTSIINNTLIKLPTLKEQQKIAEILSSVDAAIEKTEQVIAKTEEVKKGLMQQLLTKGIAHTEFKQTEIGEIPVDWKVKQMKELCNLLNGRAYKKDELLDYGKTPVLRVGNFFTNQNWYYSDLELEENKYCDNGDLLYAWSASFGPRIWDGGKAIYHYHIWKLDLFDNINRDFMYYLLLNDVNKIKKSTTGSTMIHISKENMEPRLFAIPSLYEQEKIANILVNQDLMIKHESLKLDRLNNLKKGLMQQLLTGQVRVKVD